MIHEKVGKIVRPIGAMQNLTGPKQAEDALHEAEERYRQLVELSPDAVLIHQNLRCVYVNGACVALLGATRPEELLGRSVLDLVHPDFREVVRERIRLQVEEGKTPPLIEQTWLRPDGSSVQVEVYSAPFVFRGKPAVQAILHDVTERKEAEDALRQFRAAMDISPDLILLIDRASMRFVDVNNTTCRVLGYRREELLALGPHDVAPVSREELARLYDRVIAGDSSVSTVEMHHRRKDGSLVPVELFRRAVPSRDGHIIVIIARDITERQRADEALRDSEYRLDLALAASGLATWEWTFSTREVRFSQHWWPILGYRPDDIPLRLDAWEQLTHPNDLKRVKSMVAAVATGSIQVLEVEYRMQAKNAQWHWIRSVGRVVERDAAGLVMRMTGTHGDITERKQVEQRVRESQIALQEQAAGLQRAQLVAKLAHVITGPGGSFVKWSETLPQLIGVARAQMPQSTRAWLDIVHVDDREKFRSKSIEAAKTGARVDVDYRLWRADGVLIHVRQVIEPIGSVSEDQDGLMWFCTIQDVTEQTRAEQKIKRLNRVYAVLSGINALIVRIRDRQELFDEACRIAVEHGGFCVGWIALLDPASGTVTPVAHAGLPMDVGAGSDPAVGLVPAGPAEVALRERRPAFDNDIERNVGSQTSERTPDTFSLRRTAIGLGAKSVIVLPLFVEGKAFGMLTLYAAERNFFDDDEVKLLSELAGDISFALEFIAKEEKVDYLAYYDTLTGLPNGSLFVDQLAHQLGTARRDGLNVALVLMDLDRFRLVNDTLGRQVGDALLKSVAQRIKDAIRDQDSVARVSSDGFAVAISSWGLADVAHVVESRNKALFERPFLLGQEELRVTATAGVALFPDDGDNPETLFANAEAALRDAKVQNARLQFYSPQMNARVADSLRMENRLRRALENGELVLWYQPKVSIGTRRITGFEALMRWQDPESTLMVPPAQFIPLMERTGLILEAGRWALSQVARDCALWSATGVKPPRIAVNVSPIQLRQKAFVADVIDAAAKTKETGGVLDLEITESVVMEHVETIIPVLKAIRGFGVEIAVDDFGTGYSSLAYIARLPINDLKIDRSFVIGMTESADNLAIVKSIISLAHSLRLVVVAEGVETEEQAALLLELGCDQMQGYLFSRPVPPQQVPKLLRQQDQTAQVKPAGNGPVTTKRSSN